MISLGVLLALGTAAFSTASSSTALSGTAPFSTASTAAPGCRILDDVQHPRGIVEACRQSRDRIRLLFGEEPAGVLITFAVPPARARFVVARNAVTAIAPALEGSTSWMTNWISISPHEIAHNLYFARTGVFHTYGSGNGDWFMEAVASWAEDPVGRLGRLARAQFLARSGVGIAETLDMHHPNFAGGNHWGGAHRLESSICRGFCPGRPDTLHLLYSVLPDGSEKVDTLTSDSPLIKRGSTVTDFYALSLSVLQFIHTRGGPAAVRAVEQKIRAGEGPRAVLRLPGLPATLPAFEREWRHWLSNLDVFAATR
jgi:hypothetical protein